MIKIWGRPTSICTQRALWGLVEAGQPFELTLASATMGPNGHVSKGNVPYGIVDTPAYRAMNPNSTVPTIDDDGFVLWESIAILTYLAGRYAPEKLYGSDARKLARATQWMLWTGEYLLEPLHVLVMELARLPEAQRNPANVEKARLAVLKPLAVLEEHLGKQPFVAGDAFTLGDIPVACDVQRWLHFDLKRPPMPNITSWQRRLGVREGFKRYVAPKEHHLAG